MSIIDLLTEAQRQYYETGDTGLTDDEYDALEEFVKSSGVGSENFSPPPPGTDWPIVGHITESNRISYMCRGIDDFQPMVQSRLIGMHGSMSMKHDGLSCELQYGPDGRLEHAVLKGRDDGASGEDVLANVIRMSRIPLSLPVGDVQVWVELTISENNLRALNELRRVDGLEPYKTARNAVAIVRSKKARGSQLELFVGIALMVYHKDLEGKGQRDRLQWLVAQTVKERPNRKFFPVEVIDGTAVGAWIWRQELEANRQRWAYLLDGVVWRDTTGRLTKIKFDASAAITTVLEIVEQLGRTGIVSFVVRFESVRLAGADVQRATGHNAALIASKFAGIGVGAKVLVSRRGDVIPHIERVVEMAPEEHQWTPSGWCPSCGAKANWDGSYIRCSADPGECPGTVIGLLRKFVMEHGIKGLGPARLTALVESGIETPADLYTMTPYWLADIKVGGSDIGIVEADRICNDIGRHAKMTWGELLGSVGIPGCAGSVMTDVARLFPTPDDLLHAEVDDLIRVPGVGVRRAEAIAAYLDTMWSTVIGPLTGVVTVRKPGGSLDGKVFCITLALSKPRPIVEGLIRQHGGETKGSVSNKVTHVVCNSPNDNSGKLKKAREIGTPIISETELYAMMGAESAVAVDVSSTPDDADF